MGQMDNVVARLSDIDAAAKKIMDQAALKKKDMEAENRQRQKAFDQELESKTKETLEELSQRLEERSGRQLENSEIARAGLWKHWRRPLPEADRCWLMNYFRN